MIFGSCIAMTSEHGNLVSPCLGGCCLLLFFYLYQHLIYKYLLFKFNLLFQKLHSLHNTFTHWVKYVYVQENYMHTKVKVKIERNWGQLPNIWFKFGSPCALLAVATLVSRFHLPFVHWFRGVPSSGGNYCASDDSLGYPLW